MKVNAYIKKRQSLAKGDLLHKLVFHHVFLLQISIYMQRNQMKADSKKIYYRRTR